MRGVGGKPGWFWLFALMGAFTVASGFVLGFLLPDSFKNPRSTFLPKVSFFTQRELHILKSRVLLDDPMKGKKKKHIGLSSFKQAVSARVRGPSRHQQLKLDSTWNASQFSNWRLWIHFLITLSNNGPQRAFDTYSPSIVNSFGFAPLASNALASVGLFLQIPVSFCFSYVSDRM
jgi:hypothetical protein